MKRKATTLRCRLFGHKFLQQGYIKMCQRRGCYVAELPADLEANEGIV
jgi:hypothetical protein